ncbi:MAG: ATP-binding protein, partial [Ktedonobacterales bacterium]
YMTSLPPVFEREIVATLLADSARAMATFFGFDEMNFLVLDHERRVYRLIVREGIFFPKFQPGSYTQPFGTGMLGLCHVERRTVLYNDVRDAPQYVRTDATVRAELCVPVVLGDAMLAILDTGASHVGAFTPAHATFIEGFARYLAPAIADPLAFLRMWRPSLVHAQNALAPLAQSLNFLYSWHDEWRTRFARLYTEAARRNADLDEKSRMLGALEERNRLARDLHDTLVQSVVGILRVIEGSDDEAASLLELRAAFGQARALAHQSLDEVRRSVWNLQPAELERQRLPEALRVYLATWSQRTGVEAHFHLTGTPHYLGSGVEADLLHIAQEALSNVARHAMAAHAVVSLQYTSTGLRLAISDDGKGFVPDTELTAPRAAPDRARGLGLRGMRERARLLGGQLEIERAPGPGTCIVVTAPALMPDEKAAPVRQGERISSVLSLASDS